MPFCVNVHDKEVVNLSIDKATINGVDLNENVNLDKAAEGQRSEDLFHFVHPELDKTEAWRIHDAVKRVARLQGIQMICQYLAQLRNDNKVLLPPNPSAAYAELVRLGMPNGEGFSEKTFQKYNSKK